MRAAENLLAAGWRLSGGPTVQLDLPVAWVGEGGRRSWWFHLNSLDPLACLLDAHDTTGDDERYLRPAASLALDWARSHPGLDSPNPFAWYDMAVGLRAYRLAYLLDAMARADEFDDIDVEALVRSVLLHAEALADDAGFASHSNHGVYQAAGQLAMASRLTTLPTMGAARRQALDRIRAMVDSQFTAEGVHTEHSPGYHWAVARTYRAVLASGLVTDPELVERLTGIDEALAWFVKPDGRLVMFGDTTDRKVKVRQAPDGARAFPESGYFVVRSDRSYVALAAAFHSRTHKHADDLSFVWFDRGRDLLVDAGSFGYAGTVEPGSQLWDEGFWYSHPSRVYVESTRAHNTVEIDGRSYQRRDRPYGSALRHWTAAGDVHAVEAVVCQFGTVEHRRVLVVAPGRWVLVVDDVADVDGTPHDLAQRFHFAPDLDLDTDGTTWRLDLGGGESLFVVPLEGALGTEHGRGRDDGAMTGWISRRIGEMTPCWSASYTADSVARHTFATVLALGTDAPVAGPRAEGAPWSWRIAGRRVEVAIRTAGGGMDLQVRERDAG